MVGESFFLWDRSMEDYFDQQDQKPGEKEQWYHWLGEYKNFEDSYRWAPWYCSCSCGNDHFIERINSGIDCWIISSNSDMQQWKYNRNDHPCKKEDSSKIEIRLFIKYYNVNKKECSKGNI